ncbi:MAG: FkbM family methyltransferase [Acidimicrobiales bacterium]
MAVRLIRRGLKTVVMSQGVHRALSKPQVCRLVTPAIRPLAQWLPRKLLFDMPVRRDFEVKVPHRERGFRFEVDSGDSISKALFWYGLNGYERHAVELLSALATKASSFLDVGANTGVYSLLAAASNDNLAVHAFEPVPSVFARLQRNARLNHFANLALHQMAVSSVSGRAEIHVPADAVPLEASLLPGFRANTDSVSVQVTTIDDFVAAAGIARVDVLKVDTEGTSRMVIAGALNTLSRDAPLLVCEVLYAVDTDTAAWPLLRDLGYLAFLVTPNGLVADQEVLGDPEYRNMNYVFSPADRVCELTSVISIR